MEGSRAEAMKLYRMGLSIIYEGLSITVQATGLGNAFNNVAAWRADMNKWQQHVLERYAFSATRCGLSVGTAEAISLTIVVPLPCPAFRPQLPAWPVCVSRAIASSVRSRIRDLETGSPTASGVRAPQNIVSQASLAHSPRPQSRPVQPQSRGGVQKLPCTLPDMHTSSSSVCIWGCTCHRAKAWWHC